MTLCDPPFPKKQMHSVHTHTSRSVKLCAGFVIQYSLALLMTCVRKTHKSHKKESSPSDEERRSCVFKREQGCSAEVVEAKG